MSALPLFWAEGDPQMALSQTEQRAPIIAALDKRFDVQPIDLITAEALMPFRMVMLAQPGALSPRELVSLDEWIRAGGHAIIFADPALEWPSIYGLGDPRRAPLVTLLDPLFTHWNVQLTASALATHQHDAQERSLMDVPVFTNTPGRWISQSKMCEVQDNGFRLSCQIEKGRAILVADADLLDEASRSEDGNSNSAVIVSVVESLTQDLPQKQSDRIQDQRKNNSPSISRDDSNMREMGNGRP